VPRLGWLLVVAALATAASVGLAAAGGGGGHTKLVDRCAAANDDYADTGEFRRYISHERFRQMVRGICNEAVRRGFVRDDHVALADAEIRSVVVNRPPLFYPFCRSIAFVLRDTGEPGARRYISDDETAQVGRRICDAAVGGGYVDASGDLPAAALNRVFREHPDVFRPFCVANLLVQYAKHPNPTWTLDDASRLLARVCTEAMRRGLVTATGAENPGAVAGLAARITQEMRSAGDLP
jgi:hypothetical protein